MAQLTENTKEAPSYNLLPQAKPQLFFYTPLLGPKLSFLSLPPRMGHKFPCPPLPSLCREAPKSNMQAPSHEESSSTTPGQQAGDGFKSTNSQFKIHTLALYQMGATREITKILQTLIFTPAP